ncbi:ATP synthase F1 subunit epsilon [Alloiococcus sp. CFN-8]|uniref:ATP synthase F1 subunit epsilon n=1 Tax=Alloiococcus sp. CFN-8 TaxID=3416081 RepID=UPI003CF3376F
MIKLRIVTPQGFYKELETSILNVVTTDGKIGILPSHMPVVAILEISNITTIENDNRETYAIAGGMLYFERDKATILTPSVESSRDIDLNRAEKAKERAEVRLKSTMEGTDIKRAELALKRALNRLKAAENIND